MCGEVPPTLNGDEENNPNVNEDDNWGDFDEENNPNVNEDDVWGDFDEENNQNQRNSCCLKVVTVIQMFHDVSTQLTIRHL